MALKSQTIDSQNTSPKEVIRKHIRNALMSNKSTRKYPEMDLSKELFEEVEQPADLFVHNFRSRGGKFIPCTPETFPDLLMKLLKGLNYNTIFCPDQELQEMLKKERFPVISDFFTAEPANSAIVFADTLIARSGSMVFKQDYAQYPSIKNLAKEIFVIAKIDSIVPGLKEALAFQECIDTTLAPLLEIITPSEPEIIDGKEAYSATNQRFILFLIC